MSDDQSIIIKANEAFIIEWLKSVDAVPASGFKEATDLHALPDGPRVHANSVEWTKRFLSEDADPYRPKTQVKRSIHHAKEDTYDTLRHDYACQSNTVHLSVIETVEFMLIRVEEEPAELAPTRGEKRHKVIDHLAHGILRMSGILHVGLREAPYHWIFHEYAGVTQDLRFSTAPLVNPITMSSWADRMDGGIHKGHWFFMGFKRREDTSGRIRTLNGQHWFDGECWKM